MDINDNKQTEWVSQGEFFQLAADEMTYLNTIKINTIKINTILDNQMCANTVCFGPYWRVINTEINNK